MRFGLFVPQGWRLDLVGIAPAEDRLRPYVPADALARTMRQQRTGPLVGTPEQIVERLRELRAEGLDYAIANFHDAAYDDSGIRLYAEQVVPELS